MEEMRSKIFDKLHYKKVTKKMLGKKLKIKDATCRDRYTNCASLASGCGQQQIFSGCPVTCNSCPGTYPTTFNGPKNYTFVDNHSGCAGSVLN